MPLEWLCAFYAETRITKDRSGCVNALREQPHNLAVVLEPEPQKNSTAGRNVCSRTRQSCQQRDPRRSAFRIGYGVICLKGPKLSGKSGSGTEHLDASIVLSVEGSDVEGLPAQLRPSGC